jgi:ferritin
MIDNKVFKLLNDQFNLEVQSSLIYLNLCTIANDLGLVNFSDFLKKQSEEEMEHANKIRQYCLEQKMVATVNSLEIRPLKLNSAIEIANTALKHERIVTASIHNIYKNCADDFSTKVFLQWFISEQVEEEAQFEDIITLLQNTNDKVIFDNEIAKRYSK